MTNLPRTVKVRDEARWTEEEDGLLRTRFLAGRGIFELARLHGREIETIRARLQKLGLSRNHAA